MSLKNAVTPPGIHPGTFRLLAVIRLLIYLNSYVFVLFVTKFCSQVGTVELLLSRSVWPVG